jgi:hypothetical protein
MGSSFIVDRISWGGMGVVMVPNASLNNIQKDDCHNE